MRWAFRYSRIARPTTRTPLPNEAGASARQSVTAPLSSTIGEIDVREGQQVAKDAPLLRLAPSPQAAASYAEARSALSVSKVLVERTRTLLGQHLATQQQLAEDSSQLALHEEAYGNNVTKIKHATQKLSDVRTKIAKYDAELKMSRAEAEMAKLATSFNFDVTTDFGQIEQTITDKIGLNRAKVRVAADLSGEGVEDIHREQAMEKALGDQALKDFEVQMGLVTPEVARVTETEKQLGPAEKAKQVLR